MANQFEVDYQAMDKIAKQFSKEAAAIQKMYKQVSSQSSSLAKGGWQGRGSTAFFKEMQDLVLPAVQRLYEALEEASRVTGQVSQAVSKAEEEASNPFRAV